MVAETPQIQLLSQLNGSGIFRKAQLADKNTKSTYSYVLIAGDAGFSVVKSLV